MRQRLAGEKPEDQQRGAAEGPIAAGDAEQTRKMTVWWRVIVLVRESGN